MKKIISTTMDEKLHAELKIMAVQKQINLGDLIEILLKKSIAKG